MTTCFSGSYISVWYFRKSNKYSILKNRERVKINTEKMGIFPILLI